ncbi:hypothetical protein PLICRDRAFT_102774 [Plicaturopsis crispa FD-325 SS-3]|nr:hypothetical protein PLICRDRAFT_102774 [Plicaturopsis crispa FD-325 SS-3]
MSRAGTPSGRSGFASKTTFEGLDVDSGEESEVEEVEEPVTPPPSSESAQEVKPTKTALKKLARAARLEKQQKQKPRPSSNERPTPEAPTPEPTLPPPVADIAPVAIVSEPIPDVAVPVDVEPATEKLPQPPPTTNGYAPKTDALQPQPDVLQPPPVASIISTSAETSIQSSPEPPFLALKEDLPTIQPRVATAQEAEQTKKRQNMLTRTLWTFIMIGGFIGLLLLGHAYMVLLVMLCQTLVYREVTALFSLKSSAKSDSEEDEPNAKDPWSKTLNWYFFAVTNYFLYGESIIYYFKHVVFVDAQLLPFATNHRIISFTLYTIGFVGFVMSLKKGYLKQQFGLFCWVHMSLLLIVVSSHFIMNNILEGLIWFFVPASLVICNDVFAYIWGISIGRTPLIKLSPKKTVEGFVGAFWSTIIFGILWGTYFMRFDYMICPVHDLGVSAWSSVACSPNPIFVWREWELWKPLAVALSTLIGRSITTIPYAPYQFHLLFMSCFASLVAPFGGFFASGFKRAFNIKDFGHSIPGHGGMTDRMDCQFLMGVFTYVYYSSLIRDHHVTVGSILQTIVSGLTVQEQLELIADLKRYLEGQGIHVP